MYFFSRTRAGDWLKTAACLIGLMNVSGGHAMAQPVAVSNGVTVTVGTQGVRRANTDGLLKGPSLVVSGFSGANDNGNGFINVDGASVSLFGIDDLGPFVGNEAKRPAYVKIPARAVGQIFGVALDDAQAPSLYLTATSAYGLPISGADQNRDGQEDKLLTGRADARFMEGLFGPNPENGPGSVWKVDGVSGEVSLFASLKLAGKANAGPALGNIAFDKQSQQLFVSDLDTGMIFRLDMDGNVLEAFDHGTTARSLAGLPKVAFDGTKRLDIRDPDFDVEDPQSWHFAPAERRVWGLAAHEGRLYYAVANGPEVWSVGIAPGDGGFLFDARKELILPEGVPDLEITDIAFGPDGSMILAQRGERVGSFDFSKVTRARRAEVLRFFKDGNDNWRAQPATYAIGFASQHSNGNGGVALGPNYKANGQLDANACQSVLWSSGERLRFAPTLQERLTEGGAMRIDGAQAQPFDLSRDENTPPWKSHFIDYDGAYPNRSDSGLIGDVEVFGCQGIGYQPPREAQPLPEDPPVVPVPDRPAPPELTIVKRVIGDCDVDRNSRTHRCGFSISVTNRGDRAYTDSLMITDSFSGANVIDVKVSRGRDWHCSRVIDSSIVCLADSIRIEAGETQRVTLDMRLAAPSRDRRFDNCALVGAGQRSAQQVTAAQMLIEANGIRSGGVDGKMGPNTQRGLRELQALLGMTVTGELSPALFANAGTPIGSEADQSCVDMVLSGIPLPPPPVEEPPVVVDPPVVVPLPPLLECDLRSTRARGNRCSCRYDGMRKVSPVKCACPRGSGLIPGRGCVNRPRPAACDKTTTIQRGKACLCRYDNMVRRSPVACACPRGTKLREGRGCVRLDRPRPARCDARTTVLRNNRCDCRYPFMAKRSNTSCRCLPGLKFVPGRGCQKVGVPQKPRCDGTTTIRKGKACVCRYPNMRKSSRTSCACKPGARFLPGRGCVSLRPLRDGLNPRKVVPLLRQ
nr:peptidoglycan-binding domain-containing protein [uncultured Cohaesibacter sp.]